MELHAQEYPIKTYTVQDGLSQMQVQAVFRDSRGYLWIGTKQGFCKFNGENFEQFSPKQSLIGNYIYEFEEDSKGNIYFRQPQIGITKYDGKTFTRLRTGIPEHNSIHSFAIDNQDHIYTLSNEGKLHTFVKDSLVELNWPSLTKKNLKSLIFDKVKHQLLCLIDSVGLVYITPKQLIPAIPAKIYPKEYASATILTARNGQKVLLINGKDNSSLYYLYTSSAGWLPFLSIQQDRLTILSTVSFDWFFVYQQKTFLLEANTKQYHQVLSNIFASDFQQSLAYSPNGTWMATENGLVFIVQNGFRYFSQQEVPTTWSVVEDNQQRIWALNWNKPLISYNGLDFEAVTGYKEVMKRSISKVTDNEGVVGDFWYYQPIKDKLGYLWLPHTMGIMRHDGKRFEFLIPPTAEGTSSIAMCLLEDPSRNLIIQGGDKAVYFWENKSPFQVTSITAKDGLNVRRYVFSAAIEKAGIYWLGGSNIIRYDADHRQCKEYSQKKGNWNGLNCIAMKFDNRGTLWIGSASVGLCFLDRKTDSFVQFPNPILNEMVNSILQLDPDHLLIGGAKDIYILDLKTWYAHKKVILKCYNHHNGFIGLEPAQNAFFKDSQGRIWMPSRTVLSVIDSKRLDLSVGKINTYFTYLNRERIPFAKLPATYIHALPHGTGDIRLEFESVGED